MSMQIQPVHSVIEYLNAIKKYTREVLTIKTFRGLRNIGGGTPPAEYSDALIESKISIKWFRGQAENWPLIPKIYRPNCSYDEREMMFECRRKASTLNVPFAETEYPSWLFLMQHHGLPTRLLDWTESSAAALFFAVENWREYKHSNCAGRFHPVVWVLNPHSLNWVGLGGTIIPGTAEDEAVRRHGKKDTEWSRKNLIAAYTDEIEPHKNPIAFQCKNIHVRMQVQRSRFTAHGSDKRSINDIFTGTDLIDSGVFTCINVDPDKSNIIADELRELGISHSTLFPDLEGVAKDLAENFNKY